jgi:xanthine dehydrogenase accessory factor
VSVLLEPLAVVPSVAVFGLGHVGTELARILSRHDLELHLVDGRKDRFEPERLAGLDDAVARIHLHHAPVPELVLGQVPRGTHVLVMTHDHAEDVALCDAALRCSHLGSIGLIGSSAKWRRFEQRLAAEGHSADALRRIQSPIGLPGLTGKSPAVIAVAVAADLLATFDRERAAQDARS